MMPCGVCGAHPRLHRSGKRGHDYSPMTWPMEAVCGRCGREARLFANGWLVCPVCSKDVIEQATA